MALVTVRILDGPDRGKKFHQLATPVTIGREEGNLIQLNDLRVSRHHLKIHESSDAVLMTDLQSTNGTKVNGESVRVWQLHPGDLITAGRSLLLFGSSTDIADRLADLKKTDLSSAVQMGTDIDEKDILNRTISKPFADWTVSTQLLAEEVFHNTSESTELLSLQMLSMPMPPIDLLPQQAAQMEAFLQYLHLRLRHLIASMRSMTAASDESPSQTRISISSHQWQHIIDIHDRIASLMSEHILTQQN